MNMNVEGSEPSDGTAKRSPELWMQLTRMDAESHAEVGCVRSEHDLKVLHNVNDLVAATSRELHYGRSVLLVGPWEPTSSDIAVT